MASTVTPSVSQSSSLPSGTTPHGSAGTTEEQHSVLLVIQSTVLVTGSISLGLMVYMMKSRVTSGTSIAVLNLIFTHFLFLVTLPFRIYYHATHSWNLGQPLCRVTSGMIHIHLFMSFIFYVIILVGRLISFYCKREFSFKRSHTLFISIVVWVVVLVVFPYVIYKYYHHKEGVKSESCFNFGENIQDKGMIFNYITTTVIITVSAVLMALQANAVRILYGKRQSSSTFHQDFGAHLMSLCFAGIMMACFVPYHIFRLIYMKNLNLENVNEVFLNLTTFNCLDMLTFLGNRWCYMCIRGKNI